MPDINKYINNPDVYSPNADRELVLEEWDREFARRTAAEEGVEMTEAHWQVVHCLRSYYLEHGVAQNARELGDMLAAQFNANGGKRYLRRLFPRGPVEQGMHIAGLPLPPYTIDRGAGVSL